jgi:small conductance mechanosensitive channel
LRLDFNRLGDLLVLYGINFVGALVVAAVGWWAAGAVDRMTRRALLASSHMDVIVAGFLSSLARYAVLTVAFVVILQLIGIQATSLIAVLGAASLAIGLALQGTLTNMAAGVMLLIFRPFRAGDSIEVAGKSGTVKDLSLFTTELAGGDNVKILIPNGQIWGAALTNLSAYPTRRMSITFTVPLDQDVDKISAGIRSVLTTDRRVLGDPPPTVTISNFRDIGIEISVQAWCRSDDAGALRTDLMSQLYRIIRPAKAAAPSE